MKGDEKEDCYEDGNGCIGGSGGRRFVWDGRGCIGVGYFRNDVGRGEEEEGVCGVVGDWS